MKAIQLFPQTLFLPVLGFILGFWAFPAEQVRAARVPEARSEATHVVVGVVQAVFTRTSGVYNQYIVRIRVERVERGSGVAAGDMFYAYCFQRGKVELPTEPGALGHKAVPKEGQRIKAFVNRRNGLWEGVYPDWFDIEKSSTR